MRFQYPEESEKENQIRLKWIILALLKFSVSPLVLTLAFKSLLRISESSNCYKKLKRTERKRKKSKSDIDSKSLRNQSEEIIDLISDEEVDKTPPRNSMQIKRWRTLLDKLHSKAPMTQCKDSFINRMSKSPNDEKMKLDQSILKVWISFMRNLTLYLARACWR